MGGFWEGCENLFIDGFSRSSEIERMHDCSCLFLLAGGKPFQALAVLEKSGGRGSDRLQVREIGMKGGAIVIAEVSLACGAALDISGDGPQQSRQMRRTPILQFDGFGQSYRGRRCHNGSRSESSRKCCVKKLKNIR